jgi:hypothetical protein
MTRPLPNIAETTVSMAEAGAACGCSTATIRRRIRSGMLDAIVVGTSVRVTRASIVALLEPAR